MTGARLVLHQARLEQQALWRNPDTAFFTFALPVGLLLIFGSITGDDTVTGRPGVAVLTLLVPGILAFGIVVAAYGTLAATVAGLRADGVLKRVRATPLPPAAYVAGHLVSVLVTSAAIAVATLALGWLAFGVTLRPGGFGPFAATLAVGIVCFSSLGLAVSALIPTAAAAGPVTNATYVPLAMVSGTFDVDLALPGWLGRLVAVFPVKPLTDGLRAAYDPAAAGWSPASLAVLAAWAVVGVVVASRWFRWDPS